jgi:hypothetical protein
MPSIASVQATSTRTVAVTFSSTVEAVSPINAGDALNPASYVVTRNDTGASLLALTVSQGTGMDSNTFTLYLLDELEPYQTLHTVDASAVQDTGGSPITPPTSMTFPGCAADSPALVQGQRTVDLRNDPVGPNTLAGTIRANTNGDYDTQDGAALLRKLILRRLTTTPGSYFHLDASYGLGITEKQPLVTRDLVQLKKEIERQVALEPEVAAATARVDLDTNGTLEITITAQTQQGQLVVVPFRVPNATMNL